MANLSRERLEALEAMVDSATLAEVLEALADICHEKADHLRVNWQDSGMAVVWDRAGGRVQTLSQVVYDRDKV